MQFFGALLLAAALAAPAPVGHGALVPTGEAQPVGEAYVAELDADWNVTREVRATCPADAGCTVDLALDDPALAAVHVRFDALSAGAVAVRSRLEDRGGGASALENQTLALDRAGFGAGHYEARRTPSGEGGPIIMMAVRLPGWTAPGSRGEHAASDRT